nr:hypothetical protein CFP56_64232 [Quercus suber]
MRRDMHAGMPLGCPLPAQQPPMGMLRSPGHVPSKAKATPMGRQPRLGHAAAKAKADPYGHAAKAWIKHIKNIIPNKEAKDSSSIFQASQAIPPVKEVEDSSSKRIKSIKYHPHEGSRRFFLNSSGISSIIPMEEAEDSSPIDPSTLKQILNEEAEDSSPKYPQ